MQKMNNEVFIQWQDIDKYFGMPVWDKETKQWDIIVAYGRDKKFMWVKLASGDKDSWEKWDENRFIVKQLY